MWRVGTSFSLLSGGTPGCALSTFNSGSWRAASFSTRGGEGPRICIPGLDSDCLVLLKLRLRPQLLQPPPALVVSLMIAVLVSVKSYLIVLLIRIFLMAVDFESRFVCC